MEKINEIKSAEDIKAFFETKRTYRKFLRRHVENEIIDEIAESGRISSCGMNRQAIKLVVVKNPEYVKKINSLVKYAGALPPELGTPHADEIPDFFIAVIEDTSVAPASDTDAGLVIGNMTACAWMYGVGSCIMGAIDRKAIKELFNIPEEKMLHSVIAFGYPKFKSYVTEFKGDTKYFLDADGNTCVPKKDKNSVITVIE